MKSEPQKIAAPAQAVSIGSVLHYRIPKDDIAEANDLRKTAAHQHSGHKIEAGDVVPLIVTALGKEGKFNGQAFLDGNDTLWVKTCTMGENEGQCTWPKG